MAGEVEGKGIWSLFF